ncbi:Serine/threonine-protein kinase HT1 [Monoraphidium neglectum]|uniref:Serine/threonine-protein kinase HT1 n=1 Tax=Monoraphidium neglectum TaxID=145388 RepID=A0A0D2MYD8_9CHLO|nr:Serine/threonine-protein kinase HT1 [Monoraphidium neglectum]KIZ05372.1 Serine/threonine-protein kinase HT1 [Monoraphidium neglectum]|eukprot:XP_013904391.1 Serine/threonine-protein kinase HT1 [Monoraphidium neglectum]
MCSSRGNVSDGGDGGSVGGGSVGDSGVDGAWGPPVLQRRVSAPAAGGGADGPPPSLAARSPRSPCRESPRVRRRTSRLNAAWGSNPSRLSHTSAAHAPPASPAPLAISGGAVGASCGGATSAAAFGCGGEAFPDPLLLPSLPQVDFIERIGKGSFGEVFKASAREGEGAAERAAAAPAEAVGAELARHEYESWLNANLRHPQIVQLFTSFTLALEAPAGATHAAAGSACGAGGGGAREGAAGATQWKTHLIMEWCDMGTMQCAAPSSRPLPSPRRGARAKAALRGGAFLDDAGLVRLDFVLATAKEVCAAVAYLHGCGVVHGDLKATNVLLKGAAATRHDGRGFCARVSDFGLSQVMEMFSTPAGPTPTGSSNSSCSRRSSCTGSISSSGSSGGGSAAAGAGAPCFGALTHAAPELLRGAPLSRESDVYAVGVLLWELVTCGAPFHGMNPGQLMSAKLSRPTADMLPLPDWVPRGLAELCQGCWRDDPACRPPMEGVIAALNRLAVELLGQDRAVAAFPDVAKLVLAMRRAAAAATAAASADPHSSGGGGSGGAEAGRER